MNVIRRTGSRSLVTAALAALVVVTSAAGQKLTLPNQKDSVHFAVLGDTGTGTSSQQRIADRLAAARGQFPFDIVLLLGDNLYGGSAQRDYENKFERPYAALLSSKVKFYAALGNHDNSNERLYKPFNMNGERYYTFKPSPLSGVRFFALDSNYLDQEQLAWFEKELAGSKSDWKIVFFHHPLYSSGGEHGSDLGLRKILEPLFLKYGVDIVFSGHDHFYERIKPQQGIYYFVSGGAAKLRSGDIRNTGLTAKGFDTGYHFMLVELLPEAAHFQVISDQGATVDSGVLPRRQDHSSKRPDY
jgi:predicted phosphodiesterase